MAKITLDIQPSSFIPCDRLERGVRILAITLAFQAREAGSIPARRSSFRQIPLVGTSLWTAKQVVKQSHQFAFPKYCNETKCNNNSVFAALNKWLKPRVPDGCVIHLFGHNLRDRLRAVECPADIIDAIGGWTTEGFGHQYGKGHDLGVKARWMHKLTKS